MSWNSRSKEISATTDEVKLKITAAEVRSLLVARISGTFVGTIKIQTSDDNGKTWADGTVVKMDTGATGNPTGVGTYCALLGASANAGRVIFSAYTSGAARIEATTVPNSA